MFQIIPLQPQKTKFNCVLDVDNKSLNLFFETDYNSISGTWLMTIKDNTGKELISKLPLIPAENILEQFRYLQIGSAFLVPVVKVESEYPSNNLGTKWVLWWGDTF